MYESPENQEASSLSKAAKMAEGAAKLGKAISNILKGAAKGGLKGAALEAIKSFKKEIVIISIVLLSLPVLFVILLPQVIFGGIDGTDGTNILNDNGAIVENISKVNHSVSTFLQEAYEETLAEAQAASQALEYSEVETSVGESILFDANQIICWYSASQNKSVEQISISHLIRLLNPHKKELYHYTTRTENREITYTETNDEGESVSETKQVFYTIFTIEYSGDAIFPEKIFNLDEEQISHAKSFAENLSMFLYDDTSAIAMEIHKEIGKSSTGEGLTAFNGSFGNPFPGQLWSISSPFGGRPYPGVGSGTNNHTGMDLPQPAGTSISAVADGTVLFVRDSGSRGYGKHLAIDHGNGVVTLYAHCSAILVSEGQTITQGQVIAEVGTTGWSTGNHLHIEVFVNGTPIDPSPLISNG